jgi:lysophospholipase L1-like esterase
MADDEPNVIVNGDFHDGLRGWSHEGEAQPVAGGVRLGGGSSVSQPYVIGGERIVYFGAHFTGPGGGVRTVCYDAKDRVVMTQTANADPKKLDAGVYFKTQGKTSYLKAYLLNGGKDAVDCNTVKLIDYDRDRKAEVPLCDLDEYMTPIWKGDTIYNETVLPFDGGGRLLLTPTKVLSIKDSSLTHAYQEGVDYLVQGRELLFPKTGAIRSLGSGDFPSGDLPWYSVAGKHLAVTYTHAESWPHGLVNSQAERLPNTVRRLKSGRPLTVVAYGDSITLGINVSGYRQEAPFMPTWPELFVRQIGKQFGDDEIKLYNAALGGMASDWGATNAKDAVASLNPDLVTISFGMNDFWWIPPALYRQNIESIIATVRRANPRCEFILISPLRFDPAYTDDKTYNGNFSGYPEELKSLAGPGIAYLDMNGISQALYSAKKPKDLITDPMHPDDFLARIYAQSLVAVLGGP